MGLQVNENFILFNEFLDKYYFVIFINKVVQCPKWASVSWHFNAIFVKNWFCLQILGRIFFFQFFKSLTENCILTFNIHHTLLWKTHHSLVDLFNGKFAHLNKVLQLKLFGRVLSYSLSLQTPSTCWLSLSKHFPLKNILRENFKLINYAKSRLTLKRCKALLLKCFARILTSLLKWLHSFLSEQF